MIGLLPLLLEGLVYVGLLLLLLKFTPLSNGWSLLTIPRKIVIGLFVILLLVVQLLRSHERTYPFVKGTMYSNVESFDSCPEFHGMTFSGHSVEQPSVTSDPDPRELVTAHRTNSGY